MYSADRHRNPHNNDSDNVVNLLAMDDKWTINGQWMNSYIMDNTGITLGLWDTRCHKPFPMTYLYMIWMLFQTHAQTDCWIYHDLPWFTIDLPLIYHDLPWFTIDLPLIYHGFTTINLFPTHLTFASAEISTTRQRLLRRRTHRPTNAGVRRQRSASAYWPDCCHDIWKRSIGRRLVDRILGFACRCPRNKKSL